MLTQKQINDMILNIGNNKHEISSYDDFVQNLGNWKLYFHSCIIKSSKGAAILRSSLYSDERWRGFMCKLNLITDKLTIKCFDGFVCPSSLGLTRERIHECMMEQALCILKEHYGNVFDDLVSAHQKESEWKIEDTVVINTHNDNSFWNPDHQYKYYHDRIFVGTFAEVMALCSIEGVFVDEDDWMDISDFDNYEYNQSKHKFIGSLIERNYDYSTKEIYVYRTFKPYKYENVRLKRFLSARDYKQLKSEHKITASGRSHAYNTCNEDGSRVFCFIEGQERDWPSEGYNQSVAEVVISVPESRVKYHSANYGSSAYAIKEATVDEIRLGDIVDFHRLKMVDSIKRVLREAFKYEPDSNVDKHAIRAIRKDLQDRIVRGSLSDLKDRYSQRAWKHFKKKA